MNWAARRRFMIIGVFVVIVAAIFVLVGFLTLSKPASCSDGIQNEGEAGIDCGGPCPYLCQSQVEAPVVRFAQAVSPAPGRTDVIAYVENPNPNAAAKNISYTATLYGPDQTLVAKTSGTLDLAPGATVPVFIPNIFSGSQKGAEAFLTIDPTQISWYVAQDTRLLPNVGSPVLTGTAEAPQIRAVLADPSTTALQNVLVIATVFDATGNVIAASQTVIPNIAGQGVATAAFTWNEPFSATPARVDIIPVIPL